MDVDLLVIGSSMRLRMSGVTAALDSSSLEERKLTSDVLQARST